MLSNAYFLAKFRFDTAENEPAKNLQNFRKMHFRKIHFSMSFFSIFLSAPQVATSGLEAAVRAAKAAEAQVLMAGAQPAGALGSPAFRDFLL